MTDDKKPLLPISNQTIRNRNRGKTKQVVNKLESLRGAGNDFKKPLNTIKNDTLKSLNNDLLRKMPNDFMDQLFGPRPSDHFSAEITAGESVEMKDITARDKRVKKLESQVTLERRMRQEEEMRVQKRSQELRVQLQAIMQEVSAVTQDTAELAQEVKIAAMQAPVEPGVYHIIFFTNLLSFLKSFRKKIESAHVWLHAANRRAAKKGWLANYKKSGAKYLLSGEHYLSRNAG